MSAISVLQELAQQRFDPEKFAGIFTSGGGGPPRWLHGNNGLLAAKYAHQLDSRATLPGLFSCLQ